MRGTWRTWLLFALPVLLLAVSALATAAEGASHCLPVPGQQAALALAGESEPLYGGLAVYRRFGVLTATLHTTRLPREGHLEIRITAGEGERELARVVGPPGQRELTVHLPLQDGDAPLPVGRYRMAGSVINQPNCPPLVQTRPFFVIFNPFDPRDEVYQVPPDTPGREVAANMGDQVAVLIAGEEFVWDLGSYTEPVFTRAIQAVEGQVSALAAAAALRDLAHQQVDGYWPGLTDSEGRRPPWAPPADTGWTNPWGESVPANLGNPDARGQCYDYAAVFAAFSRSVGIPATIVTAEDPAPMPYPYHAGWHVQWAFHVWNEFVAGGTWWATDATYPAAAPYAGPFQSGPQPQPRNGAWFAAAASGGQTRITGEYSGVRLDTTAAYRTPAGPATGPGQPPGAPADRG